MQIASKSPLSCVSKLPSVTEDQGLMFVALAELKLPHWVEEVADNKTWPPADCDAFHHACALLDVSWNAGWNENHGLAGFGCVDDSWGVDKRVS